MPHCTASSIESSDSTSPSKSSTDNSGSKMASQNINPDIDRVCSTITTPTICNATKIMNTKSIFSSGIITLNSCGYYEGDADGKNAGCYHNKAADNQIILDPTMNTFISSVLDSLMK